MPRLSAARREELQLEAWGMSGQGMYATEIAKELGVHRHTVRELLRAERERKRQAFPDEDVKAASTYDAVIREAWRRLKSHSDDAKAQNVVGYLNAILGAQNGKNDITGAKAPARSDNRHVHEHDLLDLSDASEEFLAELEKRTAEVGPPEER